MENGVLSRSVDRSLGHRRAAYEAEARRLVEAAFACIRETGDLEPRVSEVLGCAGLSNKAFYRHFRSKGELLVAVLDEGNRRLATYLEHRVEQASGPREAVRAWLLGMTRQVLDAEAAAATRPFALARGRLSAEFPDEVRDSEARLTAPLRRALQDGVDSGALPDADPQRDAQHLYDLSMGWLLRGLADEDTAEPADAEALVAFALRGLGCGAQGA
jgi:AcrR family transcriptional regulator